MSTKILLLPYEVQIDTIYIQSRNDKLSRDRESNMPDAAFSSFEIPLLMHKYENMRDTAAGQLCPTGSHASVRQSGR
jgi:hypothetical protein